MVQIFLLKQVHPRMIAVEVVTFMVHVHLIHLLVLTDGEWLILYRIHLIMPLLTIWILLQVQILL